MMPRTVDESALVLLSGGQDSATCLAWALARFERVETIGFAYGQRHAIELECRSTLRKAMADLNPIWSDRLGGDHMIPIEGFGRIGDTAMTSDIAIEMTVAGLPNTFVPGRNLIFFTLAAAVGYRRGIRHLVGGMCETDYSGYPDCRDDTLKALQVTLNLGMDQRFVVQTPLMWIDKAATWRLTAELGGSGLVDIIREHSHSCYLGDRVHRHEWGYGCGSCPACDLRANGWRVFTEGCSA